MASLLHYPKPHYFLDASHKKIAGCLRISADYLGRIFDADEPPVLTPTESYAWLYFDPRSKRFEGTDTERAYFSALAKNRKYASRQTNMPFIGRVWKSLWDLFTL